MTLDPFFAARFAEVRDVTWNDVYGGDPVAIDKAIALGAATGAYVTPDLLDINEATVRGPEGPIRVRTYRRGGLDGAAPCLVWLHGGAFKFGDLDMVEAHAVAAEMAARLPGAVISVDYRLVPKVQYPAPVEDAIAVVRWTAAGAGDLGIDRRRIGVGGASAGANLAAACALRLRDEGRHLVHALTLAYPGLHLEVPDPSPELATAVAQLPPMARFTPADRLAIYRDYLGPAFDDPPADAVPGLADLVGLPPTAIANAEHDDLRSSGELFASQLATAEVEVDCWTEPGMPHGFLNHVGDVNGAARTLDRFADHLRRHLGSA